jgi:hypothetical protein
MTEVGIFIVNILFHHHVEGAVEYLITQAVRELKNCVADAVFGIPLPLEFGNVISYRPDSIFPCLGGCSEESIPG